MGKRFVVRAGDQYEKMSEAVKAQDGQCPCVPVYARTKDTMCICTEFIDQSHEGHCKCKRFKKVIEITP